MSILILVVDIDGILNSHKFSLKALVEENKRKFIPYISEIDPICMDLLASILKKLPDLKIVISSSWRQNLSLFDLKNIFLHFNFPVDRIIDITDPTISKANSIKQWVVKNPCKFLVIDDESLFELNDFFHPKLYKVTEGLDSKDVENIIEYFKK